MSLSNMCAAHAPKIWFEQSTARNEPSHHGQIISRHTRSIKKSKRERERERFYFYRIFSILLKQTTTEFVMRTNIKSTALIKESPELFP